MHDKWTDADLVSLLGQPVLTRRDVLVNSLAAGFALAVQPVAADTITTSAEGLTAGEVRIPTADLEIPAYRAMPALGRDFPTVLVVQEIFGVHEHVRDLCRRLARQGYLAVAPELYARQDDVSRIEDWKQIMSEVVSRVPDAQVMSDLEATVAWAGRSGRGDTKRVAVTGFCWGGRITWLYAAHSSAVRAGVAWYGRLTGERTPLQPRHPVDVAGELKAPVLGLYGGQDQGIPLADVEQMRAALARAGNRSSEIVVFPDAPHGFLADYRRSYQAKAAGEAWSQCLAWFRRHGVG
ncbi:MAG: dienelactone hydrolase family protein [Steroidobacteraceae bacterium]